MLETPDWADSIVLLSSRKKKFPNMGPTKEMRELDWTCSLNETIESISNNTYLGVRRPNRKRKTDLSQNDFKRETLEVDG